MSARVIVHRDKTTLAAAVAARLVTTITDVQAEHGEAHVVLTGGSMGNALVEALVDSPAAPAVAWELVHLWWGDERYVERESADRNATQAREAGLARMAALGLDPANVHELPATDDAEGDDIAAAAERYAAELARVAAGSGRRGPHGVDVPAFDVVMLGVGPDAHVASLFPGKATLDVTDRTVVPETDSPKPPPARLSLTMPALCTADEVWLLVAGEDKAEAVAAATGGADVHEAPAAGVRGRRRTLWLVDEAAAGDLP
ncbi:6-phosphogluconolactonase [uncultured Arsenicicoccus sp.]|uniref:6-phosphogluconolactonase n=1 Tax=uncultured Arsenicicoccus sp. TaxID=491339 RepID=UPI002597C3EA|nr:6-phosphogluconolactonase [uncultured Arsenicicoccus sp.]